MFLEAALAAMACREGGTTPPVCLSKLDVDLRASRSLLLRLGSKESLMMALPPFDIVTNELLDFRVVSAPVSRCTVGHLQKNHNHRIQVAKNHTFSDSFEIFFCQCSKKTLSHCAPGRA